MTRLRRSARRPDGDGDSGRNPLDQSALPKSISRGERTVLHDLAQAHAQKGDAARVEALLGAYLEQILAWTRDSNLVAQMDLGRLASRHVAESLESLPLLDGLKPQRLMDVGSGGGFPGIPIAILRPELEVTLVESRRRKGLFLQRVVQLLELARVRVVIDRAERLELADAKRVDVVTARAVAALAALLPALAPLVRTGGRAILYKGSSHPAELAAWTRAGDLRWAHRATHAIPDRHLYLLEFERTSEP